MASSLLSLRVAQLFLPPLRGTNCVRRHRLEMKKLGRKLLIVAMFGVMSVGVSGQKQGKDQDKRPPKEPVKVITNDRKENRPPQNNSQPKNDNRKKP